MNTKIILLVAVFFTCSTAANAQANNTQKQRVKQGVKSGEITKAEAEKIREQRKEVRAEVKEVKADGIVTKEEKKDIKKERKDANKAIVRAKHNKQTRN